MATDVIGRDEEKSELDRLLVSGNPELLVVYGRRRISTMTGTKRHGTALVG